MLNHLGPLDLVIIIACLVAIAGMGGGFIFQSDHSVSSRVSGRTCDYIVKLVREYGSYPVHLGEFVT